MRKVLLIEDSKDYEVLISETLEGKATVKSVNSASDAKIILDKEDFDLILLDVGLPDSDGFHLCAELRNQKKTSEIPIIFITGKANVNDKVMGFSSGGDDYLVKPFEPLELVARVESKFQRHQKRNLEETIEKGVLRMKVPFQKAYALEGGEERDLNLTPIEFKILYFFVTHEKEVVSREKLLEVIWGKDIHVVDRAVDRHVAALRKKLPRTARYIDAVRGTGYMFSLE